MSETVFANSNDLRGASQVTPLSASENFGSKYERTTRDPDFADSIRESRWGGSGRATPLPEYDRDLFTAAQITEVLSDTALAFEECDFDINKYDAAYMLTDAYVLMHLAKAKAHPESYGLAAGAVGPVLSQTALLTMHLFRKWSAASGRVVLATSIHTLRRQLANAHFELYGTRLYRTKPDPVVNPHAHVDAPDLQRAATPKLGPCPKTTLRNVRRFLRHIGFNLQLVKHDDGSHRGLIVILPALPANAKVLPGAAPGTFFHSLVAEDRPSSSASHIAFDTPQVLRTRSKKLREARKIEVPASPPETLKSTHREQPTLFGRFMQKWLVGRDSGEIVSPLMKWFHGAGAPLPRVQLPGKPLSAETLRDVAFAQATMHMAALTPDQRAQLEVEGVRYPTPPPIEPGYDPTRTFNLKRQGPSLERAAEALAEVTSVAYAFQFIYEELVKTFNCCDIHHKFVPKSLSFLTRVLNVETARLLPSLAAPTDRVGLQNAHPLPADLRRRAIAQLTDSMHITALNFYPLALTGKNRDQLVVTGDFAAWRELNGHALAMNDLQLVADRIGARSVYFAGPRHIPSARIQAQISQARNSGDAPDLAMMRKIKRAATLAEKKGQS